MTRISRIMDCVERLIWTAVVPALRAGARSRIDAITNRRGVQAGL